MGNFSRDTFNALKHYVGVRLQQGVPIVDADWNEMEDIRKFELEAFLKWFVGDGVPKGDDGFRIESYELVGQALDPSSSPTQGRARIQGLPSVSGPQGPSGLEPGPGLPDVEAGPGLPDVEPGPGLPDIEPGPGLPDVEPGPGLPDIEPVALNNFGIKAGRCLVEGWEVINEESLWYTEQFLYNKPKTAEEWGVPPLKPLNPPADGTTRTDLVYLDVWEREVDSTEDYKHLVHPDINIETCVRLKREWVVRVAEDLAESDKESLLDYLHGKDLFRDGHAYYPLARLTRTGGTEMIYEDDIQDLRQIDLNLAALENEIADARGAMESLGDRLDRSLTDGGQLKFEVINGGRVEYLGPGSSVDVLVEENVASSYENPNRIYVPAISLELESEASEAWESAIVSGEVSLPYYVKVTHRLVHKSRLNETSYCFDTVDLYLRIKHHLDESSGGGPVGVNVDWRIYAHTFSEE